MTPEEHALMVAILANQLQFTKAVLEILNSRDLVEEGDLGAFLALVQHHQQASEPILETARQLYLAAAQQLGIETGL
jgi:hypothetical protein